MSRPVVHRLDNEVTDYTYCGRKLTDTTQWHDNLYGFAGVTCKQCVKYPNGFTQPRQKEQRKTMSTHKTHYCITYPERLGGFADYTYCGLHAYRRGVYVVSSKRAVTCAHCLAAIKRVPARKPATPMAPVETLTDDALQQEWSNFQEQARKSPNSTASKRALALSREVIRRERSTFVPKAPKAAKPAKPAETAKPADMMFAHLTTLAVAISTENRVNEHYQGLASAVLSQLTGYRTYTHLHAQDVEYLGRLLQAAVEFKG